MMHGQVALGDVQVRAAYAAGSDGDEELAVGGFSDRVGDELERTRAHRPRCSHAPRAHRPSGHDSIVLLRHRLVGSFTWPTQCQVLDSVFAHGQLEAR
jgi:hypothetical protein